MDEQQTDTNDVSPPPNTKAIVENFFKKDSELSEHSKRLKPIRGERKELYDTLISVLEQSRVKEYRLPSGKVVSLEVVDRPVPLKKEYLQAKLAEIMGNADQAEAFANQIWEERPLVSKPKLKFKTSSSSSEGAAGAGAKAGDRRKRARA